jgi:hypothetical protein
MSWVAVVAFPDGSCCVVLEGGGGYDATPQGGETRGSGTRERFAHQLVNIRLRYDVGLMPIAARVEALSLTPQTPTRLRR